MFISHGRQYIFIHIPKTGGTSMALALEERAKKDDILIGDTPKAAKRRRRFREADTRGRLWKHSTLADIEGLVGADEVERYFTFTMVRNPWDRVVSYYHWLRDQSFDHPAVTLARGEDFSGFLSHPQTWRSLQESPARSYMTDARGNEVCDLYIRLERAEEDAAPLVDHLGFELDLPRVNASARQVDYRRYYSDTDAAFLADICAEDIARFGYSFDPVDMRAVI
ncbi:sulfotransferase family 2 domain-containing protein [Thalassovita mangrovi]|uniref:Sulfotransferase family 2 domain-containing protein n=1 Tax=Thalassovita mangrovi TaxID=2692236 RepID=A0A6L8LN15_9RHOB|nr:sulfotransferase family 2 domain-containing protein [Thalassovita mangrovi]MYM57431.1 sulfotransferase family 2 domain-containing protein [Thalassovita mangrovi]